MPLKKTIISILAVLLLSALSWAEGSSIVYYVNDASLNLDEWCTAPGDDANDGLSPATPMATVQAVLDAYDLEPGDEVRIDTGAYNLSTNIEVTEADCGSSDAPVTFAASPYGVVMDRGSTSSGRYVWYLNGSDYVTITTATGSRYPDEAQTWMQVTNAYYGIYFNYSDFCQIGRIQVYNNDRGIYANESDYAQITNCLIHGNNYQGVYLKYAGYSSIINNTIVRNGSHGVYFYSGSLNKTISNNIIWSDGSGKYCLCVSSGDISPSDYNLLYATNGAMVGYKAGSGDQASFADWQVATGFDLNSLSTDPGFVDADNGDFHLQSTGGSYHDGAWRADGSSSPAIDAGEPTTDASGEPTENGGRINLGAFGGSEQASKTPLGRVLFVRELFAYEVVSGTSIITWLSPGQGWEAGDTIAIEYSADNGATWTEMAASVPAQMASENVVLISDDVESGGEEWTADAPWGVTDSDAYSTSHCWTDSPDSDYSADTDASLTSGRYDIEIYDELTLTYWHRYDFDKYGDYGRVEVSTDDGITWTRVATINCEQPNWVQKSVDLSPFVGQKTLRVRFRMDSDGDSSVGDGWYIDDIELTGQTRANTIELDTSALTDLPYYRIRITSNQDPSVVDESNVWFAVHNGPIVYYVNDASLELDEWCTEVGADETGRGASPGLPAATVQWIIDTFDLKPGDEVRIDTGEYNLSANIEVTDADSGSSEAPVTFAASPYGVIMDRGGTWSGSYGWHLNKSDYVAITTAASNKYPDEAQRWMQVTNADRGVHVDESDSCQIGRIQVFNNFHGIFVDRENLYGGVEITNCLIHDNVRCGIFLYNPGCSNIINNTIVRNGPYGIWFYTGAGEHTTLSNNIVWSDVSGGSCLAVPYGYGINSDFNLFYATNGAMVGHMNVGSGSGAGWLSSLGDWQEAIGSDLNSLYADPEFVDSDNGDFHLQSTGCSYHDGAWTADGSSSPAIDAGDPTTHASGEPAENGGRINLGAFGGSEQASKTTSGRVLFVREPFVNETVSGTSIITWLSPGQGWQAGDTLTIEYSADNGATWTKMAASVPAQLVSESVVLFSDDVESGAAGWTAEEPWGITDSDAYSTSHSWTNSPGGDYTPDTDGSLTSGIYNIEIYDVLTLTYWHRYDGGDSGDYGRVEASTDGGSTWNQVASINADQADWVQETVDLSSFVGQKTLRVRFRMERGGDSTVGDGWYIDDVELTGQTRPNAIKLDTTALTDQPYYRIRITSNEDPGVVAESDGWFTVHNGPIVYYVNDASLDLDEWCTAVGSDETGRGASPGLPAATVQWIIDTYDLEPGDEVRIDTGGYNLSANIELTERDCGSSEAPVTFVASPYGVVMDRGSSSSGCVWYLNGSDYVVITTAASIKYPDEIQNWVQITNAYNGVSLDYSDYCKIGRIRAFDNHNGIRTNGSHHVEIINCLIHNNDYSGIFLDHADYSRIINNTIVRNGYQLQNGFAGIRFFGAFYATISNNIIWSDVSGKYCLYIYSGSISKSDYNLFYATNGAMVGNQSGDYATLSDWQTATGFDLNSLSIDPGFVDSDNGDFHLQSEFSSYHDGAWTADGLNSPAIYSGDPDSDFSVEPSPNGGRINIGAYGGTEQASREKALVSIDPTDTLVNSDAVTLAGTMESGAIITVTADTAAVVGAVTYPDDTHWQCTISSLIEGTNTITVTAEGGSLTVDTSVAISYDDTPPWVTIGPVASPTYNDAQTISGTRENGAVVVVEADTDAVIGSVQYEDDDSWSCVTSGLAEGDNRLTVTATDGAGNTASGETVIQHINPDTDTDNDGLPNAVEDADLDGMVDAGETDPNDEDSDDDGILDGIEDADKDGEVDAGETDPCNADSDGDGYLDGVEIVHEYDPNDDTSVIQEGMARILYVRENPTGEKNGRTWTDAFSNLSYALKCTIPGDRIWVAKGTYKPTDEIGGEGPRYRSYQMKNNVSIYGGFAGDENPENFNLGDRDSSVNKSVLSGDIGVKDDNSDNCYHVFYHSSSIKLNQSAVLDGFSIVAGNADSDVFDGGGGMSNHMNSPTIENCIFSDNHSSSWGGGAMHNLSSSPVLKKCIFSENSISNGSGGGMFNLNGAPVLINCTFSENTAVSGHAYYNVDHGGGGGIFNYGSSPLVKNCFFFNNSGYRGGGILNYDGASPTMVNSTFSGNIANGSNGSGGGVGNYLESNSKLTNCTLVGNVADYVGGGISNLSDSISTLVNCIVRNNKSENENYNEMINCDNSVTDISFSNIQGGHEGEGNINADPIFMGTGDHPLMLASNSPCINTGNPATTTEQAGETDLAGNGRMVCRIDMGAYEHQNVVVGGDLNGDCSVGLEDAVKAMKILAGRNDITAINLYGDMDGDGRIGMPDALGILQKVAAVPGPGSSGW